MYVFSNEQYSSSIERLKRVWFGSIRDVVLCHTGCGVFKWRTWKDRVGGLLVLGLKIVVSVTTDKKKGHIFTLVTDEKTYEYKPKVVSKLQT